MINEPAIERNNPLWELATEYLSHLQFERRLSNNTLYAYNLDLKKYTHFLFSELHLTSINSIKASHIENFVKDLNNGACQILPTGKEKQSPALNAQRLNDLISGAPVNYSSLKGTSL